MERLCFTFEIYEGQEDEYKKRHDEIWPELVADIQKAGFKNYSLFRRGTQIIAYVECHPDADTAFAAMGDSDANRRWAEWFREVIVNLTGTDGKVMSAREVWHLD
jgi:L-rhamnose mutarotase